MFAVKHAKHHTHRSSPVRRLRGKARKERPLHVERLEDRRLLTFADFELSSLLPANGGDGSNGFVVDGITDYGKLGYPISGSQPLGDINQDGIDDFYLAAPQTNRGTVASQAYLIFGRAGGGFPAELDLTSLSGTNGYVIHGVSPLLAAGGSGGGAGDVNHDGIQDIAIHAAGQTTDGNALRCGRTFVLYGGGANLAALDAADGSSDGRIALATFDAPTADGTNGFVINGYEIPLAQVGGGEVGAAGDVNGDGVDDLLISSWVKVQGQEVFVVFGRDSTVGNTFPAAFELSGLEASNGGDGSDGFTIRPLATSSALFGFSASGSGDLNDDGIGDIFISDAMASPSGRTSAGQVHVVFGQTSFAAAFDLASLNGSNGFTVSGKTAGDNLGWFNGPAGDVNGDGVDDFLMSAAYLDAPDGRTNVGAAYVLFGTTGAFPAFVEVSALNGSSGFVMYGVTASDFVNYPSAAGDVNGDGYDDVFASSGWADPNGISNAGQTYIVYGRPSFGASIELASLLAANGGDGSAGYALNGFLASSTLRTIGDTEIGDINGDGFDDVRIGVIDADSNGLTDNGQTYIVYGHASPAPTKFYVVNDASPDRTYEYYANGTSSESYAINSGNTVPRGAASTIAGEKVWVVDANRKVYVYNAGGGLLGSWTAGTLASNATVEGIATNGTDIWIVDAKSDKVYKYSGAATRLSGSQNAASSFNLNSGNTSPKDIVTDGRSLWVVNDSTTDKVFKYKVSGSLIGSWTISSGGGSPTGITLDPSHVSNLWIVDRATDRVYQYNAAATRTSGSQSPAVSFALAAGNTNPQGIADPPVPSFGLSPESVDNRRDADSSANSVAATNVGQLLFVSPGIHLASRSPSTQKAVAATRGVDEFMTRLGTERDSVRSTASTAATLAVATRRIARVRDLEAFPDRLDAAIESLAYDLAATSSNALR